MWVRDETEIYDFGEPPAEPGAVGLNCWSALKNFK
jgi:hypothetical protein